MPLLSNRLVVGSVLGLAALAAFLALAPGPASAAIGISGDWVVNSSLSYTGETITVSSTNGTDGNILIMGSGDLHLEGTTLIVPFNRSVDNQGFLEARNSTIRGTNFRLWLRGAATFENVSIENATFDGGSGLSGTIVANASVSFDRVSWSRGWTYRVSSVHLRLPVNFTNNYLGPGTQVSYELGSLSAARTIEVAGNTFALGSDYYNWTTGLTVSPVQHTGTVTYDIHDNTFEYGQDGIYVGGSSPTTTYRVHDISFYGEGGYGFGFAVELGYGNDRFGGVADLYNLSFAACEWAASLYGVVDANVSATMTNVTITGCNNGITANEGSWTVRDSTVVSTSPQYEGRTNGHIYVRHTVDTALSATATFAGGSVEHLVVLNVVGATWQGGVPVLGDLVALRDGTGSVGLWLDPMNWTAREIVWWGVYFGSPQVDNRDLRPQISDGPQVFPCVPSPFLVTEPMSPLTIVCNDNRAPTFSFTRPAPNWIQNWSNVSANGSATEYGSGINTFEWSLDNASWGPVAYSGAAELAWSFEAASVADGTYTIFLRAVDRTGNTGYGSRGPIVVDTVRPSLGLPTLPVYAAETLLNLSGTTEAFATVSYRTTGGDAGSASAAADGSFDLVGVALEEGFNSITIVSTDRAGNFVARQATITVDTVPPAIVVFQETVTYTKESSAPFAGLTEADAVVRANTVVAARSGESFNFTLALSAGLNQLNVTATDAAGNTARWYGAVWYDADLPWLNASVTAPGVADDGTPVTRAASVSANGTLGDSSTRVASLTVNGDPKTFDGSGAFFLSLEVGEGLNTFVFTATDLVGNVKSLTLRVLRDSAAPTANATLREADSPLVLIDSAWFTRGTFVIVELSMSEEGLATVQSETRAAAAGPNRFNVSLHEGTNTIAFSFRDRAGNLGTPGTLGVVRDSVPPRASINSPPNGAVVEDARVQVSGVSEAGAQVTVNGEVVAVGAGGGFSAAVDVLAGTDTTITVVAKDTLGNQNTTAVTISRRAASVTTAASADLSVAVALLVGVAAGVGIGFFVRGRSSGPDGEAEEPAGAPSAARAQAPVVEPAALPPERAQRGPKGPRGPRPPGA